MTTHRSDRKEKLDSVVAAILALVPKTDSAQIDIPKMREVQSAIFRVGNLVGGGRAGGIVDLTLPGGIPARLYRPRASGPVPTIVFFHGGGFVFGDLPGYDAQCKRLRDQAEACILSIGYRLAPEHPYPAAVEDAIAATQWAAANVARLGGDADALAVAGDSAGGNIAAVVALAMRDAGIPLRAQLLIYPAVDFVGLRSGAATQAYPSHASRGVGFGLTLARMMWYADRYIDSEDDRADWHASPLRAHDHRGLAPAVIAVGDFDPLRDGARAYAGLLHKAGNRVVYLEYPRLIHGFYALAKFVPRARRAAREVGTAFARLLNEPLERGEERR